MSRTSRNPRPFNESSGSLAECSKMHKAHQTDQVRSHTRPVKANCGCTRKDSGYLTKG
jgi:hypothetical protein